MYLGEGVRHSGEMMGVTREYRRTSEIPFTLMNQHKLIACFLSEDGKPTVNCVCARQRWSASNGKCGSCVNASLRRTWGYTFMRA
jgi:hypothetical protein